jgi:WD40 repeat protein
VDLATLAPVATIANAHERPVHTVAQLAPSPYAGHPREAHELFATAAQDGAIRLWDVRSASCVRLLSGHKNSQMRVGLALSPCLRWACMPATHTFCPAFSFWLAEAKLALHAHTSGQPP